MAPRGPRVWWRRPAHLLPATADAIVPLLSRSNNQRLAGVTCHNGSRLQLEDGASATPETGAAPSLGMLLLGTPAACPGLSLAGAGGGA